MTKAEIYEKLILMKEKNLIGSLKNEEGVSVCDYLELVYTDDEGKQIWSDAFQKAIDENKHIIIPASEDVYYIDKTITIPSQRCIEASEGAVIRLKKGVKTLMIRNRNNENGTHKKETFEKPDTNIHICGGRWEEERESKGGYGTSGMYDEERSYYGVSTCMFFNNIENRRTCILGKRFLRRIWIYTPINPFAEDYHLPHFAFSVDCTDNLLTILPKF